MQNSKQGFKVNLFATFYKAAETDLGMKVITCGWPGIEMMDV